eukprot:scaffold42060_cov29-Tisochrysis_lutea.AAC.1
MCPSRSLAHPLCSCYTSPLHAQAKAGGSATDRSMRSSATANAAAAAAAAAAARSAGAAFAASAHPTAAPQGEGP